MAVLKAKDLEAEEIPWGIHRIVMKSENVLIKITEMPPGKGHERHKHDENEVIVVLKGRGIHYEDSKEYKISAGDIIIVPKGTYHATINNHSEILKLLVIFYK